MYTYKRYSGSLPANRKRRSIFFRTKDRSFYTGSPKSQRTFWGGYMRAALYICIAAMLFISLIFVNNAAAWAASRSQIAFTPEGQPLDLYGYDNEFKDSLIDPRTILAQEMPVIYGVDLEEIAEKEHGDIDFEVLPDDIKTEIIRFSIEPKDFYVGAQGPQILIYHSHTEEAYRQIKDDEYVQSGKSYTKDFKYSVAAVGEVLKNELERYGYTVLHDTTDHMRQGLSTAYSRSLITMEDYAKKYPTIRVFIDVHRDSGSNPNDCVKINGEECAKLMFVVGTSEKLNEKPNYESNYKLAFAITNELEDIKKGFTRPIRIKSGRSGHYNQQMSDMCLLIEVGHNANSLEQAKNSAKYIALALSRVVEISGP